MRVATCEMTAWSFDVRAGTCSSRTATIGLRDATLDVRAGPSAVRGGSLDVNGGPPRREWRAPRREWRAPRREWRAPRREWRAPRREWRSRRREWRAPRREWRAPRREWRSRPRQMAVSVAVWPKPRPKPPLHGWHAGSEYPCRAVRARPTVDDRLHPRQPERRVVHDVDVVGERQHARRRVDAAADQVLRDARGLVGQRHDLVGESLDDHHRAIGGSGGRTSSTRDW